MNLKEWGGPPGRTGEVVDLRRPGSLDRLIEVYASAQPAVMRSVLAQAYALGAQMVVIEYRYLDPDYRNEHSRFYSTTFRRYPSVAHRLHFFREPPPAALYDPKVPMRFDGLTYLGYSVIRPVSGGPVGRTMLAPPDRLARYVTCLARDRVNVFGAPLEIEATPFVAQDAQLSRCAHATVWVTGYYHHLRFGGPRLLPGDIAEAVPSETGFGRPKPSLGLSIPQLCETSRRVGLPCLLYRLDFNLAPDSVFDIACRYLNSGMPVTIAGGGHAFVLVGYRPTRSPTGEVRIAFIRQDDEEGPYQLVDSPALDAYAPWEYLIAPLPEKVYVAGEKAELVGRGRLTQTLTALGSGWAKKLTERIRTGEVTFRSAVVRSNTFKTELLKRGASESLSAIYMRMQMPRWIWVVEATDRDARDKGEPCVVAEAVIDATDHLRDLHVLAWRLEDRLWHWLPDEDLLGVHRGVNQTGPLTSCVIGSSEVADVSRGSV